MMQSQFTTTPNYVLASAAALRVRQIRYTGRVLDWLGRFPPARGGLALVRTLPGLRKLYALVMGYHRLFDTLLEAESAVAAYAQNGHQHAANAELHLLLNETARPSDYAALFHLQVILPRVTRVFDVGGNIGNLYYCYSKYLPLQGLLTWQVYDLPDNMKRGQALAATRKASNLEFVEDWTTASGADLLLVSGSLHYMREPLAHMLDRLDVPPEYILINRVPLTDGAPFATIQDGGPFRVACLVQNRQTLVRELEGAGYHLEDSWRAAELALCVPADPTHTVPFYSGFLLRRLGHG